MDQAKRKTVSVLKAPIPQLHIASSKLEHLIDLNDGVPETHGHGMSLMCSIGPSCSTVEILEEMIEAGMTMARINMSHSTHENCAQLINNIRKAARQHSTKVGYDVFIGIAMDTKGPEIRTGKMDVRGAEHLPVFEGASISLTILPEFAEKCSAEIVFVDYADIVNVVVPDDTIYMDDGYISLIVTEVSGDTVRCVVEEGEIIRTYMNLVIKGKEIDLPTIGEVDKTDIRFAVEQELDFVLVSFMKDETCLAEIRRLLGERGKKIKLVSKIENTLGLRNIDAIIEQSDGVMIMRSSIGLELDAVEVMMAQKSIAAKSRRAWKPVLAATQLLVSMINHDRPKRVELFDIGNTIMDGVDGLMFGMSTATGSYPVECVKTAQRVCKQSRALTWARSTLQDLRLNMICPSDNRSTTLILIMEAAIQSEATCILVIAPRARTANLLSGFRPHCPIVVVVQSNVTARQCSIHAAVHAFAYKHGSIADWIADTDEDRVDAGLDYCRKRGFVDEGKPILVACEAKLGYSCSIRIVSTW